MFRYINEGSTYQDDGSTMGFVLNINEMYSKLDAWFCPAVSQLYKSGMEIANGTYDPTNKPDGFLNYKASDLIKYGKYNGGKTVDILSNFFFRANDDRLFGAGASYLAGLQSLNQKGLVLDLSKTFESTGTAADLENGTAGTAFHSNIFINEDNAIGNYYGRGLDATQQGVQWAVNALWLTDDDNNRLPYILFRDTNGVHLCGLYGAWDYDPAATGTKTPRKGFMAEAASADNNQTEPWSQGRQNIMLKALNLYMKTRNESLFDLSSEVKTYFTSNLDEIIIDMALEKVQRGNTDKSVIFDLSKVLDSGVTEDAFKSVLNNSTIFFLLQGTLTSYLEANKKLYGLVSTHITNSLLSRADATKAPQLAKNTTDNYKNGVATPMPYIGQYDRTGITGLNIDLYKGFLTFPITDLSIWINATGTSATPTYNNDPKTDAWASSFTKDTKNATSFLMAGNSTIVNAYKTIIDALNMTSAVLPSSSYANWSEHLNPKYSYNEDSATNAIGNGLYMAINKYLSGSQESNSIKLAAYKQDASGDNTIFAVAPSEDNYELGEIKNTGNFAGLRDAVASMMYSKKIYTSDTPLSFYDGISAGYTAETYRDEIERLGRLSIAQGATSSKASDDLISYWTFIDTLQYLIGSDGKYGKLMDYLQTSVMSYGVEADLVWVAEDNKDANPDFLNNDTVPNEFGWKSNYLGKYSYTYLPTKDATEDTYNNVSTYVDNSAYYEAAPLTYDTNQTILGMGFEGLATSSSSPAVLTSTLQNALFTDTYKSKVSLNADGLKDKHYGGWYKYGTLEKLTEYIGTLSSVADIQKIATNLGAANEDSDFTSYVVDVVKRTSFQDGDPEITAKLKLNDKEVAVGQALTPDVLKARLLGGEQTIENQKINYDRWGIASYKKMTGKQDIIDNLFTRFGGENGIAKELYDINSTRHAMRTTSDAATAGNYAKLMVIQLNNDDFKDVATLNKALTGSETDYTLLNYIAVQYAQQSSLQTQATNDVVKTILGDDNKVTVYDRRFNDKLGPTWVKNYKATN